MGTPDMQDKTYRSLFWLSYIAVIVVSIIAGIVVTNLYDSWMYGAATYLLLNMSLSWILIHSFLNIKIDNDS